MSHNKLEPYVHAEGYCCLWAWLEANRAKYTNPLYQDAVAKGLNCTKRALQQNRAAHRAGEITCEQNPACLRKVIREGHRIDPHLRKPPGTSSGQ